MTSQITLRLSAENRRWLHIASRAGFSMSWVINSRLEAGQLPDLGGHVEWLIERKIARLVEAGELYQAQQLRSLLESAQYPIGYY